MTNYYHDYRITYHKNSGSNNQKIGESCLSSKTSEMLTSSQTAIYVVGLTAWQRQISSRGWFGAREGRQRPVDEFHPIFLLFADKIAFECCSTKRVAVGSDQQWRDPVRV